MPKPLHRISKQKNLASKAGQWRRFATLAAFNREFRGQIKQAAIEYGLANLYRPPLEFIVGLMRGFVYVEDPFIEFIQYPHIFHDEKIGDCDCSVIYLLSVLTMLRVPHEMRFVFEGDKIKHVFIAANFNEQVIILDWGRMDIFPYIAISDEKPFDSSQNKQIVERVVKSLSL